MSMRFSIAILLTVVTTTCCFVAGCNQGSQEVSVTPAGKTAATDAGKKEYKPHDVPITEEQKAQLKNDTAQFTPPLPRSRSFVMRRSRRRKMGFRRTRTRHIRPWTRPIWCCSGCRKQPGIRVWRRKIGKKSTRRLTSCGQRLKRSIRKSTTNKILTSLPSRKRSTRRLLD